MTDAPWGWILWSVAFVLAISSLVKLCVDRRDELQGKLDTYLQEQTSVIANKRKILAEHKRRASLARKIAAEKARLEAEEAKANANAG